MINLNKLIIHYNFKFLLISPFILNLFISKNFKFLKKHLVYFVQIILYYC
jgi:hypothetical protein